MIRTISFPLVAAIISLTTISILHAKPNIEFDTKEYQCGVVTEGKIQKLDVVFNVKNSGDSTLILTDVRPSCGCTVVKFDSVIAPGKSTQIRATVKLAGFRSGPFSKSISVTSNAPNDSIARLSIKGTIQSPVESSTTFIMLFGKKNYSLQLKSPKKDLRVTGVSFVPSDNDPGKKALKNGPAAVRFTLTPAADSTRADGLTAYNLELEPFAVDTSVGGRFVIATDHPDRKQLEIRGRVE